jgi:hypothetical protein
MRYHKEFSANLAAEEKSVETRKMSKILAEKRVPKRPLATRRERKSQKSTKRSPMGKRLARLKKKRQKWRFLIQPRKL